MEQGFDRWIIGIFLILVSLCLFIASPNIKDAFRSIGVADWISFTISLASFYVILFSGLYNLSIAVDKLRGI